MEMCKNGIRYEVYPSHACVKGFSKYAMNATALKIPSSVYGKEVTIIGDDAFRNTTIKEAELPRTIQQIGSRAFANCANLKFVYFGKRGCQANTLTIGPCCFANCVHLEHIYSNAFLRIEECAFLMCGKLSLLGKIEKLSDHALQGCSQLVDVQLLLGGQIDNNAFTSENVSVLLCGGPPVQSDYSMLLPRLKNQNVEIRCFSHSPLVDLMYDGYKIRIIDQ